MIRRTDGIWVLETDHTSCILGRTETGQIEQIYYGSRIHADREEDVAAFREKHVFQPGNAVCYDKKHPSFSLEDMCLAWSGPGKGDTRESPMELIHADGNRTCDFVFRQDTIRKYREGEKGITEEALPRTFDDTEKAEHLVLTLSEEGYGLDLELHFIVFPECDVISRYTVLRNRSEENVRIERLMSLCMDFPAVKRTWNLHTFHGAWAREMHHDVLALSDGQYTGQSRTGNSSSRVNPFFMAADPSCGEETGDVVAFNLVYSGEHYESCEVSPYGKRRVVSGINPSGFSWLLGPGESFETPEAVMTFSGSGFRGISRQMHRFVRIHIMRGYWRDRVRPVLFNSWEAGYFRVNERKMLKFAGEAKKLGAELVVMDDGWFGKRKDDTSSLGDWTPDPKKFPGGLKKLVDAIRDMGLQFGIWVEPEMTSTDSDFFRAHPDWTLSVPGHSHSEGRNQRVLDLTRLDVQDTVIDAMTKLFGSCRISYVKWDMNRNISDAFSEALPSERQGEVKHRYILGLYRVLAVLTERFPKILFEGCASGGNRFDLGMLCFFPQIWASDDTDALERCSIQESLSYGYPPVCMGCHVSASPNHQTLRRTPWETRFHVASFGSAGFELDPADLSRQEREKIREAISRMKAWRDVFQQGTFYRSEEDPDFVTWTAVSADRTRAAVMILEKRTIPNFQYRHFRVPGLLPDRRYRVESEKASVDLRDFGTLVNLASPVHIRPDSAVQRLAAKAVSLKQPAESYTAWGDALAGAGIVTAPAFGGTGYSGEVRLTMDGASQMYYLTALPEN